MDGKLLITIPYIDPNKPRPTPIVNNPGEDLTVGLNADEAFYVSRGKDYVIGSIVEAFKQGLDEAGASIMEKYAVKTPIGALAFGIDFLMNLGQIQSANGDAAAHAYFSSAVTTGVSTLAALGASSATEFAIVSLFAPPVGIVGLAAFSMALVASAIYDGVTFNGVTGSQAVADWAAHVYNEFISDKTNPVISDVQGQIGSGNNLNNGVDVEIVQAPTDGTHIIYGGSPLEGSAISLGNGVYQLGENFFLKEGNDLYVISGKLSSSAILIKDFFSTTYNGTTSYSNIGITIPPVSTNEKSAVDINIASIPNNNVRICPIVLDLNGDGIKYKSFSQGGYNVHFDIDSDGFAEGMEWLDANDAANDNAQPNLLQCV